MVAPVICSVVHHPRLHYEGSIMPATTFRRLVGLYCTFLCVSLVLAGGGGAQTFFTDVTEFPSFHEPTSVWGDYDNDGRQDLFIAEWFESGIALLHNEGDGGFGNQTFLIQQDIPENKKGSGGIFGDYDNDGDLDLFIPIGDPIENESGLDVLLRNDRGVFRDVTRAAGLTDRLPTGNAIWLDYDLDGHLDLYMGHALLVGDAPELRNTLHRNQGDGTFFDVTEELGLDLPLHPTLGGSSWGMAGSDFNGDGWPDLYLGVMSSPNRLFLSDGRGGFRDATTTEIGNPGRAAGIAVGDINNDGNLDLFQGNVSRTLPTDSWLPSRSLLLLNLGEGQFLDITEGAGLSSLFGLETTGAGLADIDNDGDLDLLIPFVHQLLLNTGKGAFVDQTPRSGIGVINSWTASFGDYDLDGFLDVFMGGTAGRIGRLYRNSGNGGHWLRVELAGTQSNRSGIGARVMATSGELVQMREILGGIGGHQDEMGAHFGLGGRTQVDRLEIRWPSGQVDVLTDIPADQKIRIIEGRQIYHVVRPTVWESHTDSMVVRSTIDFQTTVQPALFEDNAEITQITADLSALGGPIEVPLTDMGDGAYQLESTFTVDSPSGMRYLSILIDQHTSLGPYWVRLSKRIAVFPAEDLRILDGEWHSGWQVEGTEGVEVDLGQSDMLYQGTTTSAFRVKSERQSWAVAFRADVPVDTLGYTALRFAFHPGDTRTGAFKLLMMVINDRPVDLVRESLEGVKVDLDVPVWQVVGIPLSALGLEGRIDSLKVIGNLEGTFYLDDIRLVAETPSPTAVTEVHTASLPQSFTLSPNYPNPFNSDTMIRFALPAAGDVDLTIFNLAGQRVAKLAQGMREAGTHTISWDGRDDSGRALASGVYLYRLQTGNGQKVETRKLVLMK
jgi:enediyne biosynthesis protein E4